MAETIVWVDADGTSHNLLEASTTNVKVLLGVEGRFAPPVDFAEELVPEQAGSRLRRVRKEPRDVFLPVVFEESTATALRSSVRSWLYRLDPERGDGKLKVTAPDSSQRELNCRYAAGLEGAETGLDTYLFATLAFHAFDPYWYDASDNVATYTTGTSATFFPFFPLRLGSSEVFTDTTVTNDGDVECWPVWTITGPGTNPTLKNITTSKTLALTYTLGAGETITIDTRPYKKTVLLNDGTNLYSSLSNTSALWPLAKGANAVRVEMTDATADSSVELTYKRRWLGA